MPQGIVACVISIFVYYNIICSTCVCVVCVLCVYGVCVSLCYASAACSTVVNFFLLPFFLCVSFKSYKPKSMADLPKMMSIESPILLLLPRTQPRPRPPATFPMPTEQTQST